MVAWCLSQFKHLWNLDFLGMLLSAADTGSNIGGPQTSVHDSLQLTGGNSDTAPDFDDRETAFQNPPSYTRRGDGERLSDLYQSLASQGDS
jgi:hypothetical protein